MRINDVGLDIIKYYEGWSSAVYCCPSNRWTIGFGSCWDDRGHPITADTPDITRDKGAAYLKREVRHVEKAIASLVLSRAELTPNMFSACCSLAYNIGTGAFQRSQIRQRLIRGEYDGAADIWWQWRRGGGRILPGLVRRRAAERALFLA